MTLSLRGFVVATSAVLVVLSATLALGWWRTDGPGTRAPSSRLPASLTEMDFRLTASTGEVVGPEHWVGRPTIVFFGFTWCPDICPTTLANVSGWLDELGPAAVRLNVAFISVDPERDTPEVLADYLSAFHPQVEGYTGTPAELARAAEGFAVEYEKVWSGAEYSMNHTAGVLLYRGEDGRFAGTIDPHEPAEFAEPKLRRILGS